MANQFGKSETANRLESLISDIEEENIRKKTHRTIQTLLTRYFTGLNEIELIEHPITAIELARLWRNEYVCLAKKQKHDKDIKDRLVGLIRERANELITEIQEELHLAKKKLTRNLDHEYSSNC